MMGLNKAYIMSKLIYHLFDNGAYKATVEYFDYNEHNAIFRQIFAIYAEVKTATGRTIIDDKMPSSMFCGHDDIDKFIADKIKCTFDLIKRTP